MRTAWYVLVGLVVTVHPIQAQELHDPPLERFIGQWVLEGTIAGEQVTHDLAFEWVLGRQYIRLHELSRERDAAGAPAYEAIVFIGWDEPSQRYACLWLDTTGGGGLVPHGIGYGPASGDSIPFIFSLPGGSRIWTTFAYGRDTDRWRLNIDVGDTASRRPFARVTLSRKK